MSKKIIESEVTSSNKYFRVIQTVKEYSDGKRFPIDEIVTSNKKINLEATEPAEMGGFCFSTYECVFRWLIRGDTLCEVTIPENTKVYKTVNENSVYVAEQMILSNPQKLDDDFVMELYLNSKLPEKSYFVAMAACAICGYINTALKVFEDKVNKSNVDIAISEIDNFCQRREKEKMISNKSSTSYLKTIKEKLEQLKNS